MNLNLDFSNVRDNEPLAEGTYNIVLKSIEEKVSSTGKPMLNVRFEEEETKTSIFENYVLQENCLFKLKDLLTAAGIDCKEMVELDSSELIGLTFKAKIVCEDYNDSKVNRIKKIFAA